MISYAYLWRREHAAGRDEGSKNRPCVIVLTCDLTDAGTIVTVVPVTHATPDDVSKALELPPAVKRNLGLDDQPSWIMLDEGNRFAWPGFDLRPVPGAPGRYHYGHLPPRLFETLVRRFRFVWEAEPRREIPRD